MNTINLTESIVSELDFEVLNEIIEEVQNVPEGYFCTVQIARGYNGQYNELYGVFFKTLEELGNYKSIWKTAYRSPKYYINMINGELIIREYEEE